MPRLSTLCLVIASSLVAGGCGAGWRRLEDLTPRALPARTQVQLWQGRRARVLQGVTLQADSIRGVPFTATPDCDSCRVRVALSSVDSLRVGNKERGFVRSVKLLLVVGVVWGFLFRGVGGD